MTDETVTAPDEEVTAPDDTAEEVEANEDDQVDLEAQEGEEGDQSEETEAEEVAEFDFELEGQTYRLPETLKSAVMKNADYTQKTQELAQERQAVQARRAELEDQAKADEEDVILRGQLNLAEQRLQQLNGVNWPELQAVNPDQFGQLQAEFSQLSHATTQLKGTIETRQQDKAAKAQQDTAERERQAEAVLSRDIPGWGIELGTKLATHATTEGVSAANLNRFRTDPGMVKLLHKAYLFDQIETKQRAKPPKEVKTLPKKPKGKQPSKGLDDKQSTSSWMDQRNRELAKKRA